jgi:CheY-like chemotaxis protein
MELASMLAGEEFSDHPMSVCPVIAAFLRMHNDSIDDERRQDLYAYAAKVVGSGSPGPVEDERAARLSAWDQVVRQRQSTCFTRMLNAMFEPIPSRAFYGLTGGITRLSPARRSSKVVASRKDFDGIVRAVEREDPDVVLTDIRMPPQGDGWLGSRATQRDRARG